MDAEQRGTVWPENRRKGIKRLGSTRLEFLVDSVAKETRPIHNILDIGCSYGWGLNALTGKAPALVGIDMDKKALEQARKNYPHIEFVHQNAGVLPFESETFDVAILSEVIEHVGDENKQLVIDEACRTLKPGGLFIFSCPYAGIFAWLDPMDFKRRFTPVYRLYMRVSGYKPSTPIRIGHKHLSIKEIRTLFAGRFVIEKVSYCGMFSPFLSWILAFAERLRIMPRSLQESINKLRGWESGVPFGPVLSFNIRITARKTKAPAAAINSANSSLTA